LRDGIGDLAVDCCGEGHAGETFYGVD